MYKWYHYQPMMSHQAAVIFNYCNQVIHVLNLSQSFIVFPVKTLYAYYTFLLRFLEALKNGMQTMNTTKSRWPSDITE